jgi:hypothetical protein
MNWCSMLFPLWMFAGLIGGFCCLRMRLAVGQRLQHIVIQCIVTAAMPPLLIQDYFHVRSWRNEFSDKGGAT